MDIIGVDHIQLAVPDLAAGVRCLSQLGYEAAFREAGFDHQARSYYRRPDKDMAYCRRGASRVEMITGSGQDGPATYLPVFVGADTACPVPALDLGPFRAFRQDALATTCAARAGAAGPLDSVVQRARRPEPSAAFWQSLGFDLAFHDADWYRLDYPRNIVSMPLSIFLARTPIDGGGDAKADDFGCSSIALLTRNLNADRAALTEAGRPLSEAVALRINGRPVTLCFVTGPSGELVELLEFGRT